MAESSEWGHLPRRPWSVGPLHGKYYGTDVLDANGNTICTIWLPEGIPSEREEDWLREEGPSDSHYESQLCYDACKLIVEAVNAR